jgi:hypothetical protein
MNQHRAYTLLSADTAMQALEHERSTAMILQPRSHISHYPWRAMRLCGWQRGFHVLLLVLALAISSGVASAAALPIPQGPYGNWVVNRSSGKCLATSSNSMADGVLVWQLSCQQEKRQAWQLTKPYLGSYTMIVNNNSSKCVDVPNASLASGEWIQQFTCHGGTNQQWLFRSDGQGYYYVVNQSSGMCLDIAQTDPLPGVQVVQTPCRGALSQRWGWVAIPKF